ncbi:MAG: methyltransferase domain-containing protein [wastewater metagenome]|nr:methyltransferase domain-containing protein [Candidatus Loosdrechtia aerotolerans]
MKEFYLTGGEPLLHPQITDIVKEILRYGPATILSNGTLITEEFAREFSQIFHASRHMLDFRISLEDYREAENDQIRGKGSFQKAVRGIRALQRAGFRPIITVGDWKKYGMFHNGEIEKGLQSVLCSPDIPSVRLKKLPLVLLGRCSELIRPYNDNERVTGRCFEDFSPDNLQCATSRMVTSKGVYVCPLLINDSRAWMGSNLKESTKPYVMESPACYTCRTSGLTCQNDNPPSYGTDISSKSKLTENSIKDPVRESVNTFYAAAIRPQEELCCPISYNPSDVSHIPRDVLNISYGCGSPVTLANITPGESVLDLGSGGGIDCFIAAKRVGENGYIIGVDMTNEMLINAHASRRTVAKNLGFDNVRFIKGFLEEVPLTDGCVDLVTSNCVINLSSHKEKVFQEIFRVLKSGGRFVISDIVSEKEIPLSIKQNRRLWGECIAGAVTETQFVDMAKSVGFYGLEIVNRYLYKEVEGYTFYSITVRGFKYRKSDECRYMGQYAIYKGPLRSVSDDDGHTYPFGVPVEVCTDTAWKLSNPPYQGMFLLSDTKAEDTKKSCGPGCC